MATDSKSKDDLQYEKCRIVDKNRLVDTKDTTPAVTQKEEEQLERAEILMVLNFLQCMEQTGKSF